MLFETDDDEACIRLLDRWLVSMLHTSFDTGRMEMALNMLLRSPSTGVTRLAEAACLGKKQFERVFRRHVGMNPKEYSRIVRFQKAMSMMQQGSSDFVDISDRCGYSDQSHLIREFRIYSGHTPGAFLKICKPYSDLFTNPV